MNLRNNGKHKPIAAKYKGYKQSYFNRSIPLWNILPEKIKNEKNTDKFKGIFDQNNIDINKAYKSYIKRLGIDSLFDELEE